MKFNREIIVALACLGLVAIFLSLLKTQHHHPSQNCSNKLYDLGIALEDFAKTHSGFYPGCLQELLPKYLKEIPECYHGSGDTYSAGYAVSADRRSFELVCTEADLAAKRGKIEHYAIFKSGHGMMRPSKYYPIR